jgi:ABC-type glutathione transport system ATPase component
VKHFPSQLSGGQQQRVAVARAIVAQPHILLADEPTGNLDSRTSIEVMDIFQRLNTERGITVLLITHEQDIAEYGTRIVAFRDGRIVSDEPNPVRRMAADELAALPDDDDAIGPALNILRRAQVELAEQEAEGADATAEAPDLPLTPPPPAASDTQESGEPRRPAGDPPAKE